MKIVVLDGYTENPGDLSWHSLEALGEVSIFDRTSYHESPLIAQRIGDAQIVITNKTPISRTTLDLCPEIKMISVLATGYNVVDIQYAGKKGIPVCNVPSYGTASVSQFSIAMLLEVCHHIGHHNQTVHNGKWSDSIDWCYWDHPQIELSGKTMGIIGFGRIGQAEGRIASALGMRVLAYDTNPCKTGGTVGTYVSLETLFKESDVISLHCNLTSENIGMINHDTISKMKDGVILLNNARGQLLVEKDVADALNVGKIAAAAMDVVAVEPISTDNPLLHAKNCILTPHMSWGAKESRQRILDTTVENIRGYLSGHMQNVINL